MMSRYTGRSLAVIVLRLCFVVAVAHAVRDSTLLIALSHTGRFFASLVTWFQQPGGKICLGIDDGWNWWWTGQRKIYSRSFLFRSLWMFWSGFNSLDVFLFLDAVNFFAFFWWLCRKERFFVNVCVVRGTWIDRGKWVLLNFTNTRIFLFYS